MEEDDDSGEGLNCRIEAELVVGRSYLVRVTSFQTAHRVTSSCTSTPGCLRGRP